MSEKILCGIPNCPTPQGAKSAGGWDTISPAYSLYLPEPGGVPGVPPLDRLSRVRAGVRVRAPERIGSRGGTPGTKFQTGVLTPVSPQTKGVAVPPPKQGIRPGVGQI